MLGCLRYLISVAFWALVAYIGFFIVMSFVFR